MAERKCQVGASDDTPWMASTIWAGIWEIRPSTKRTCLREHIAVIGLDSLRFQCGPSKMAEPSAQFQPEIAKDTHR